MASNPQSSATNPPSNARRRVLFVDDDALLLRSVGRMMKLRARDWDLAFETDSVKAMSRLEREPFDAVVTDMQMPEVDGATLLRHVRACQPTALRMVLSAYADRAAVHRSLAVAHRFFTKPCDPDLLHGALARSLDLRAYLTTRGVIDVVGNLGQLPARPVLYEKVTAAIEDERSSLHDIGDLVSRDIGISARVLHIVNNAFIAPPRPIDSVVEAVAHIGTNTLKNLLLSTEMFRVLKPPPAWFSIEAEHRHALSVASLAMRLAPDRACAEQAFAASMVHDIGRFVLAVEAPERMQTIYDQARAEGASIPEFERDHLGATHAEIGGYLLTAWGLPWPIVEAVAYHHAPSRLLSSPFGVAQTVYVASTLVDQRRKRAPTPALDPQFLEAHQIDAAKLEAWQTAADAIHDDAPGPRPTS